MKAKIVFLPLLLLIFCVFSSNKLEAQSAAANYNYLDFNQKPYYFGITLGYNTSSLKVKKSQNFILNDSIGRIANASGPGFNLGIVSNLRLGEYFDIRFLPGLSFAEKRIEFYKPNGSAGGLNTNSSISSVYVELPFQVRYKSAPYHDKRLFAIAGVKYSFDVASDSRTRQAASIIKLSPTDFQFEAGVGIQMYFPYFIFSPEIKFSNGLNSVLLYNNSLLQSTVIEKLFSQGITFSLHFEG